MSSDVLGEREQSESFIEEKRGLNNESRYSFGTNRPVIDLVVRFSRSRNP